MRLVAHVGIGCSSAGEVEGETLDECIVKAWDDFGMPSVCHHCSSEVEISDAYSLLLTDEQGEEVYEDSPRVDEAERVKVMVECIEKLKSEVKKQTERAASLEAKLKELKK